MKNIINHTEIFSAFFNLTLFSNFNTVLNLVTMPNHLVSQQMILGNKK
jgi:hypothetical protein